MSGRYGVIGALLLVLAASFLVSGCKKKEITDLANDFSFPGDWYLDYYDIELSEYEFVPAADLRKVSRRYEEATDTWEFRFETEGNIGQAFLQYGNSLGFQVYIDKDRDGVSDAIICTSVIVGDVIVYEGIVITPDFQELGRSAPFELSETLSLRIPASYLGYDFSWFATSGYAHGPAQPVKTQISGLCVPPIVDTAYLFEYANCVLTEWLADVVPYPILYFIQGKSSGNLTNGNRTKDIGGPKTIGTNPQPIKDWLLDQKEALKFKDKWRIEVWVISRNPFNHGHADYWAKLVYQDNNPENGKWDKGAETGYWIAKCLYENGQLSETALNPGPTNSLPDPIVSITENPEAIDETYPGPGGVQMEGSTFVETQYDFSISAKKLTVTKYKVQEKHQDASKRRVKIAGPTTLTGDANLPKDPEELPDFEE